MSSYINQYSKITTKPGANLKNTLISPYSNNAYIMLQNNIFKDNDDDNKQNNIQLFSLFYTHATLVAIQIIPYR